MNSKCFVICSKPSSDLVSQILLCGRMKVYDAMVPHMFSTWLVDFMTTLECTEPPKLDILKMRMRLRGLGP